ncbi:MAG: hypothetical protein WA756_16740 [Pseudolabrys sp.]|nr:hypothetical protein [Pseudolabrys sp.]
MAITPDFVNALEAKGAMDPASHQPRAVDANGNRAAGVVMSRKTGSRARVGVAYAARFQAYIDDLEANYGARVLFMGGIRTYASSGEAWSTGDAICLVALPLVRSLRHTVCSKAGVGAIRTMSMRRLM